MGLETSDWQAKWIGLESIEAEGEDRKMNFVPENEDELRLKVRLAFVPVTCGKR